MDNKNLAMLAGAALFAVGYAYRRLVSGIAEV